MDRAASTARTSSGGVSRRHFIGGTGATAVGLGLSLGAWHDRVEAQDGPPKYGADGMPHGAVDNPLVFVAIAPDGIVTITCHRAEMGQGVRTGVPMILADELEADWSRVRVVQAPGDEARYGNQDTDGSRTTRHFFMPMRRCGAAARQMLEAAAAARWGVPAGEVHAKNHQLIHKPTGRAIGFGEVAADAAKVPVPKTADLRLKKPAEFRYIGKGKTPIVDGFDMTTGKAQYGIDVVLPDMLFAVVARSPVYGGSLKRFDATEALKVPGVVKVVEIKGTPIPSTFQPLPGVAVIATSTWAAMNGRKALQLDWEGGPNAGYESGAYRKTLQAAAGLFDAVLAEQPDNADAIGGLADVLLEAGDRAAADELLASVPEDKKDAPAIAAVRARIALADKVGELGDPAELERRLAADPKDHQARFDLAMIQNALGQRTEAADNLLAIVKADRTWKEDGARARHHDLVQGPLGELQGVVEEFGGVRG